MTDENAPAGRRGSAAAEVVCDRSPDPIDLRQFPRLHLLAAVDPQIRGAPADILEVKHAHLADPQAEIDLAEGHGIVTSARRCRLVESRPGTGGVVRRSSCAGGGPVARRE